MQKKSQKYAKPVKKNMPFNFRAKGWRFYLQLHWMIPTTIAWNMNMHPIVITVTGRAEE